jgi:hypothetical protein
MIRAIALGCTLGGVAALTCAFSWPPDYADQSRADVATCVQYARHSSPRFEAVVREVDLSTGHVSIDHSINDARGEVAFSKCLLAVRQWRLIERNLPRGPEPEPADRATMAGTPPASVIR